jgi:hypothetical protein
MKVELTEEELHFLIRQSKRAELAAWSGMNRSGFDGDREKVQRLTEKLKKCLPKEAKP